MPYVFMVFWSEGRECNKRKKTHTHENKDSQNTLLLWKGLLSLPSSLPHSLSVSPNAYLPPFCFMWNMGRLTQNCPHSFHIWSWSEGLLEVEASGPINNHTAEVRVRQQSADEPVSTKHTVSFPPSPLPKRTTLTFKKWDSRLQSLAKYILIYGFK